MRIALIQERQNALYLFHDEPRELSDAEVAAFQREMLDQNLRLLGEAARQGADLALTSEAINFPGGPAWHATPSRELVVATQDEVLDSLADAAREGRMYVVAGVFVNEPAARVELADGQVAEEPAGLRNAAVVFGPDGREVMRYHKQFLAGDESDYLVRGHGFPVWESEFGRIGIGICWDMQFPEVARAYARRGADLVLAPTWGWERQYAAARAYENGIYVASAMAVPAYKDIDGHRRAPSQLIAPTGAVLAEGPLDREEAVVVEVADVRDCAPARALRMGCLRAWEAGEA